MMIVSILNIDIKVLTRKNDFPQRNHLRSLTQPKITRQGTFKITNIGYDIINE